MMQSSISLVWLASYPKSGNTWFRTFLTALLSDDQSIKINALLPSTISATRSVFDHAYSIDSSLLTYDEIDKRRPELYDDWHQNITEETRYHKVHDAYTYLPDGRSLLGNPINQMALYFIRNPMDVTVSFANHNGTDNMNKMIESVNSPRYGFAQSEKRFYEQFQQKLLSWSEHVLSWVDQEKMPVHVMRYEDMIKNPLSAFSAAVKFLGLSFGPEEIQKALELCQFFRLQEQEAKEGFQEKSPVTINFFRKGQIGSYRESLTEGQIERLIKAHEKVMQRFGYIDEQGKPMF